MKTEEIISTVEQLGVELRVYDGRLEAKGLNQLDEDIKESLKSSDQEVLQVLYKQSPKLVIPEFAKPYIKKDGELVIPSNCHPKYKYWLRKNTSEWEPIRKSQSLRETLFELGATEEVMKKYV